LFIVCIAVLDILCVGRVDVYVAKIFYINVFILTAIP